MTLLIRIQTQNTDQRVTRSFSWHRRCKADSLTPIPTLALEVCRVIIVMAGMSGLSSRIVHHPRIPRPHTGHIFPKSSQTSLTVHLVLTHHPTLMRMALRMGCHPRLSMPLHSYLSLEMGCTNARWIRVVLAVSFVPLLIGRTGRLVLQVLVTRLPVDREEEKAADLQLDPEGERTDPPLVQEQTLPTIHMDQIDHGSVVSQRTIIRTLRCHSRQTSGIAR